MAEFEAHHASFLSRVRAHQRPLLIGGALLALLGGAYLTWGILRFNPRVDPRENPGFDRPISQLAFIFERGQLRVEKAEPQTPSEARLLHALARNMEFSAGIMVLQLRIFVGTLAMLGGCIMMTVAIERARLLRLISHLEE